MKPSHKNQLSDSQDFRKVRQAAAHLQGQACTLAARHISDGTLRLQFNRDIAYYMQGIVRDVEGGRSTVDEAVNKIERERRSLLNQALDIGPKIIGLAGGAAQVRAGAAVCFVSGGLLCGLFGVPLMAHGANNIYENGMNLWHGRSDTEGPLRDVYRMIANKTGGTAFLGNMAYGGVDLVLSGYGVFRLVVKDDAWRLWKYIRADKVRGYQLMSAPALLLEAAADGVTIDSMYQQWKKENE